LVNKVKGRKRNVNTLVKLIFIKMNLIKLLFRLFTSVLLVACGSKTDTDKITIAAAANMQFVIPELIKQFTANTGIKCELIVGSSGKLTAQIKEGAPYDIFIAANIKYPEEVYVSGKAIAKPKVYAYGQLALWSMVANIHLSIDSLVSKKIQHIALANPKTAPYGEAAVEVLNKYNLDTKIKDKLVFGESIAQTNQFISSESVEVGFTALSVVLSPKIKEQGKWIVIDSSLHTPIEQGVVLLKQENTNTKQAKQFYDFLFSAEAKNILKKYGYLVNE